MKEKNKKMMKSMILVVTMIMLMSVSVPTSVSASAKKSLAVTMKDIKISKNKATIKQNQTTRLTVKYKGKDVTLKASYKSSNPKVVSVSKKGKITAKKKGKSVIKVKYKRISKKLTLTVRSVKSPGFPVGTYSIVAPVGGYRGSLTIDSAGNVKYVELNGGTGEGREMKYRLVVDNDAKVSKGVTAYSLKFKKGNTFQLTDKGSKVTGTLKSGDSWGLYYDANKKTLRDTRGYTWEPV